MQTPRFILNSLPYFAIAVVYLCGANLDIMEVDAAQYASISLEMFKSGEYLKVSDRLHDYLDKPPLLFWLSALSFKFFGVGTWQYKLPSILFSFLGIFSTYQLGKRLYSEKIGQHASWILASSFAMIMINNDVKTDTILVSAIVFTLWMILGFLETEKWKYLIGSAVGIAVAMLTKGPIGLIMPILAFGGHILIKKKWDWLFKWQWAVMLFLVGIMLIPMCVGLYQQHGATGLKFYFWTQSFGRITGESKWQNDTSPLFFFGTYLWSFLPWTLLGFAGVLHEMFTLKGSFSKPKKELILLSGTVLVWVALSFSRFKLPHYIFVVYPLIAILAAKYVHGLQLFSRWAWAQLIISALSCFFLAFLLAYCFPAGGWWLPIVLIVSVAAALVYFFNSYRVKQVIVPSFIMSIAIGLGMNLHFYPQLLPYQANALVGKWVKENQLPEGRFLDFSTGGRSLDFYAGYIVPWMPDAETVISNLEKGSVVYANEERRNDLIRYGASPKTEIVFDDFEVQRLTVEFLDPKTRENAIRKKYLLFY